MKNYTIFACPCTNATILSANAKYYQPDLSTPGLLTALAICAVGTCVPGRSPSSALSALADGGIEPWTSNSHPIALWRSHRRPAGTYARRHGLVLASLFGVWLPQLKMVSRHRGPPLSTLGRRRRCQREPGYLRDDAVSLTAALGAHGLEQPRMLPAGNQSRELGDLTTNATQLTTLPPGGVPYPDPLRGLRQWT